MATLISIFAGIARPIEHVVSSLSNCSVAVLAARQRRRSYGSLSSLDDHTLQDIGLHRTMLLSVSVHGTHTARETLPLELLPGVEPGGKPALLARLRKLIPGVRKGPAAEDLRWCESALGPNQLKELSSRTVLVGATPCRLPTR